MTRAVRCGLSIADFSLMSIGMILDYIYEYMDLLNQDSQHNSTKIKNGTKDDFEKYFGF